MKAEHRVPRPLQTAVAGVLVVAVVLAGFAAVASRMPSVVAGSLGPDSTTVDRLSRSYFDQPASSALALAPTTNQLAAMLAAGLLLSPIWFRADLPLVTK